MIYSIRLNKVSALLLSFLLVFSIIPWTDFNVSNAVEIGGMDIELIEMGDVFDENGIETGRYLQIRAAEGEDISQINVKYSTNHGFEPLDNKAIAEPGFVKYEFTNDEIDSYTGEIMINDSSVMDIKFNGLPTITSVPNKIINKDSLQDYYLTIKGTNMDKVGQIVDGYDIVLKITKGAADSEDMTNFFQQQENKIVIENPTPPGKCGVQNIVFTKKKSETDKLPNIEINHVYENQFQFVENLEIEDLLMYPNIAPKGEKVYFEGKDLDEYDVYFMSIDRQAEFNESNKAIRPYPLENNIDGNGTNRLTIEVPNTISTGKYHIVLVNSIDGEIISEKYVTDDDEDKTEFTVVDKANNPTITSIYPDSGPDSGDDIVEILGENIINLNIEGLDVEYNQTDITEDDQSTSDELIINYPDGEYNEAQVTEVKKKISVIIGKQAKFEHDTKYVLGSPDHIYVKTQQVTDIEDDPTVDVKIIITTSFKDTTNSYSFVQIAEKGNGYTFKPSSILPEIDEAAPQMVQLKENEFGNLSLKDETLVAIYGDNFLVHKYTDEYGNTITRYPIVIMKTANDLNQDNYEIKFDKNENKIFYYQDEEVKEIEELKFEVLNDSGKLVTGAEGNDVGNRIILRIPKEVVLNNIGKRNIQIINPKKESTENGKANIKVDVIDFVSTSESPVIDKVEPNVVTVDGGDEIKIYGSNFGKDVKVYIDGIEVSNVTRDIGIEGNKIILSFKVPAGREGTTQLQVINTDGGIDVKDFTYVITLDKNPEITSFSPKKGSHNTLVVIEGDNFFKSDPTVSNIEGMGIYRLIGTRVLLDNKDINSYNGIDSPELINYIAPQAEKIIDIDNEKMVISEFIENAVITDDLDNVYSKKIDTDGNFILSKGEEEYKISINSDKDGLEAVDKSGQVYPVSITLDNITVNTLPQLKLNVKMDNRMFSITRTPDGAKLLRVADYYNSVIFKDETNEEFYALDITSKGQVVLTDGSNSTYVIELNNDKDGFVGDKEGGNKFDLLISDDGGTITIDEDTSINLTLMTPYTVNDKNVIIGNRTKVVNKKEIYVTIPQLEIEGKGEGWYDLTVINPDTNKDGDEGEYRFYYFSSPQSEPEIYSIEPNRGSTDGGYSITINGKEFEQDSIVTIGGKEVESGDIHPSIDGKLISVKVPPYDGNIAEEFNTDSKTVPVVVINKDGGTASKEDGFTYVIPRSHPEIEYIDPQKQESGQIVEIYGYNFRYYEPYRNRTGGAEYNPGDEFEDINNNGTWDSEDNIDEWNTKEEINHSVFDYYYTSPILPKVYFGNKQAKIVNFSKDYLKVIVPDNTQDEKVNVYVVNNDCGLSNEYEFTYESSNPIINAVLPGVGDKDGGYRVDILGSKFRESILEVYEDDAVNTKVISMPLVKFGDITNRKFEIDADNAGRIDGGHTTIRLNGDLSVEYNLDIEGNTTLTVMLEYNGEYFKKDYEYDNTVKFIPLNQLENPDGENYIGHEFIKVEVDMMGTRLFVDRGYSPEAQLISTSQLEVIVPTYYTVGIVPVTVINPDLSEAQSRFEYSNPDSNPVIYDITPKYPVYKEGTTEIDHYIVKSTLEGGLPFTIEGDDFREGVEVIIGQDKTVDITRSEDGTEILAECPRGSQEDLEGTFLITVINKDKIAATSKDDTLVDEKPIYFVYEVHESNPEIDEITPNSGSAAGGEEIIITGSNFRVDNNDDITVKIGGNDAEVDIRESTHEELVIETPQSDVFGPVDVHIQNNNAFGYVILRNGFTYYSNPEIDDVSPSRVYITGGEEVTIKGKQFMQGFKLYIDDKLINDTEFIDENTIKFMTTEEEEGYKELRIDNPDGGSVLYKSFRYIVPLPEAPTGFIARPGHGRSIVLSWDETDTQYKTRYKIIGKQKGEDEYRFIGETENNKYYLTDLEPDTKYYFKLSGVNQYGESKGYSYSSTTTLDEEDDLDDDKYDSKDSYDVSLDINYSNNQANIILPELYIRSKYNLNLTQYDELENVEVTIPLRVVLNNYGKFTVKTTDVILDVPFYSICTGLRGIDKNNIPKDSNVKVFITQISNREKSRIEGKLSRSDKCVSKIFNVSFKLQQGRNIRDIIMHNSISLTMISGQSDSDIDGLTIAKYEPKKNSIEKLDTNSRYIYDSDIKTHACFIYAKIINGGKFLIIKNRVE